MWETTVVESRPTPRRKGHRAFLILSIVLHVIAGAALFISTLFGDFPVRTPSMMESYRLTMLPAMAPPPPPPPPPKFQNAPVKVTRVPDQNAAPTVIPDEIPDLSKPVISENVEEIATEVASVEGGEVGGVEGGEVGGIITAEPGPVHIPGEALIVPRDAPLPLVAMSMTYPQYPETARINGIEGEVLVRYRIGKNGRIVDLEVLRPADKLLTEAAVKAIKYWRFRPKLENGKPIEVVHELTVRFVLQGRA